MMLTQPLKDLVWSDDNFPSDKKIDLITDKQEESEVWDGEFGDYEAIADNLF